MHLGLTLKKEVVEWLETRDWSDETRKDEYMKEIAEFLKINIK